MTTYDLCTRETDTENLQLAHQFEYVTDIPDADVDDPLDNYRNTVPDSCLQSSSTNYPVYAHASLSDSSTSSSVGMMFSV